MQNIRLYQKVINDTNIFSAIYSLESYIFEKNLLSESDLKLYYELQDKYDHETISKTIKKCQEKLEEKLLSEEKFDIKVFFKAKKYDEKSKKVEFRPLHTADLITQICIVSILNVIMYKINEEDKRQLSDLSQLLPSNFYGNLPSAEYEKIFYPWKDKYKEYTEDVMKEYESIRRNSSFRYEVALDLKKFFPSVNPSLIFNFILEKIGAKYSNSDRAFFEKMLKKILCFNVINLNTQEEVDEYFYSSKFKDNNTEKIEPGTSIMNIGIPQGLPQAYFFGNIAMIVISKEFDKMFPGKSFYYVDDSVIYTNSENACPKKFSNSLEKLNENISKEILKYTEGEICTKNIISYEILVHTQDKSFSASIDSSIKMSKAFLTGIGLEASRVSFEIYNTTNEIQDISISDKILNIYEALEIEIENVKNHIEKNSTLTVDPFNVYLKSLIRYKKFFGYRKRILELRQLNDITNIEESFRKKFISNKLENSHDFKSVFQHFDEDIFLPEATLIINGMSNDKICTFKEEIKAFEKRLAPSLTLATCYFSENFSKNVKFLDIRYRTLKKTATDVLGRFDRKREELIKNKLRYVLEQNTEIWLGFDRYYNYNYNQWIYKYSNTYKRKILNSYISTILNVEVNDDIEFIKLDKRPLKYYELRILLYIRNKNALVEDFIVFLKSIINNLTDKNYEKVDFSLIEVLNIFKTHIRTAELIDNLILVHKYVSSVWRNGSRFLYFYTLHNQEHSVELIKSSVDICKKFDFLQIKSIDYYILFLSCYLHDISMILQPSIDSFLENNAQTDEIYTSFLKFKQDLFIDSNLDEFHFDNKSNVKAVMKEAFQKVNYYFESVSRDLHVVSSANFIKSTPDLNFIDLPIRSIVSAISSAHGANTKDIYGLKSNAKNDVVSEKYMMILLRVADLLDISKDRVSLDILDRNISNMPKISQYHWITHSVIDKFEIKSKYEFQNIKPTEENFISVLKRENFIENVIVEIHLNTSNITNVKSLKCKDVSSKLNLLKEFIEIEIGKGNECKDGCNFLCKWICHKNAYLLSELNALQLYTERTPNLNFTTKIKVKLNFHKAEALKSKYFDIVSEQIQ